MLPVPWDMTRGRFIHETVRALSRRAEVRVFLQNIRYLQLPGLKPKSYLHGEVGDDYKLPGLEVEAFSFPAVPGLTRGVNGLTASRVLEPRVRAFRPDVVIGYWVFPDGHAALRVARSLGVPCVISARGTDVNGARGVNAWMARRVLNGADHVITVSEAMRGVVTSKFGVRPEGVTTIVNGFNAGLFRPADSQEARAELGVDPTARMVLYVGRLIEAKGMRELFTAAAELARRDARFRLVLVGDGVMKDELSGLVAASGLSRQIVLVGGVQPSQVARWIAAADVVTLPSWSEGYPNAVVEAAACGRPVVATNVGGVAEIIHSGNGILVPPRDPSSLRDALARALDEPWDRQAIAQAMQRSWDDVAADTIEVCGALLRRT